jgi:hypothetical protein
MADPNVPTIQPVMAQVTALQDQLATFQNKNVTLQTQPNTLQNTGAAQQQAPAQQNIPQAASFALTPATTILVGLIDFSSKLGQSIYKQGCDKLTDDEGFLMTPTTTLVFVKAFENHCTIMGWNQGAQNVAKFTNQNAVLVNVVKNYGQIDEATLKAGCKVFCREGGANVLSRAAQNNHMMAQCLKKSLTVAALAYLKPYQSQYLFDRVEYGPLMYKIFMRLARIDSVAATETLRANLNNLHIYAASVNGDIDLINSYFDMIYLQILVQGSTIEDPIAKLFDAYLVVPDFNFKQYMAKKQDDYHYENLGPNVTHENLMAQATAKFTYLTTRKIWGSKSPDKESLIAMTANLKGKLKLAPALADKCKKDGGNKKDKDVKAENVKLKNKKNTSNKKAQKLDEAWKRVAPKEGEPTKKDVGGKTYQWCIHHMAWGVHSAQECCLGASRKDAQKDKDKAKPKDKALSYAAAAGTVANPSFAAFLSELSNNKE